MSKTPPGPISGLTFAGYAVHAVAVLPDHARLVIHCPDRSLLPWVSCWATALTDSEWGGGSYFDTRAEAMGTFGEMVALDVRG